MIFQKKIEKFVQDITRGELQMKKLCNECGSWLGVESHGTHCKSALQSMTTKEANPPAQSIWDELEGTAYAFTGGKATASKAITRGRALEKVYDAAKEMISKNKDTFDRTIRSEPAHIISRIHKAIEELENEHR